MLQGSGRVRSSGALPSERETKERVPGSVKKRPRLSEDRGRVHIQQLWDEGAVRWKLTPQRSLVLVLGLVLRASIPATATVPAASAQQEDDQKNDKECGGIHNKISGL